MTDYRGKEGLRMTERNCRAKEAPHRGKKKMGAWLSALALGLIMGGYALFILFALTIEPDLMLTGFAVWLLFPLAGVIGLMLALRQRLKEIDGGEEDDAAQY